MISAFSNIWKVPELRSRILYTLAMIVVVRLGVAITLPGVDPGVIESWLDWRLSDEGSSNPGAAVGALLNVFSGGGLTQCGLFALGIMPYISASIMMQLMTVVVPKLAKLSREDGGRQKINQYTRIITIIIAVVQGFMLARTLENPESAGYLFDGISKFGSLVPDPGIGFQLLIVLTIVAGTMLLMWVGDQMTERGVGNGTSLIITINIISALPGALVQAWEFITRKGNTFGPIILVTLIAFLIIIIAGTIAITQGQRRIAIQYAKRAGRGGRGVQMGNTQTQYLPLKVNYAGVMPIIFATALLSLPAAAFAMMFRGQEWVNTVQVFLSPMKAPYYVIGGIMIFAFSYFWVATMFQPKEISENLKKSGGYIPGVRPGDPTSKFLDYTMTRLTFAGAIFITILFVLPAILSSTMQLPPLFTSFFGGTSLLILVGVVLDLMRQIETHLLQRHYDGFLRKGKMRGRYEKTAQGQVTNKSVSNSSLIYLWVFIAVLVLVGIVAMSVN